MAFSISVKLRRLRLVKHYRKVIYGRAQFTALIISILDRDLISRKAHKLDTVAGWIKFDNALDDYLSDGVDFFAKPYVGEDLTQVASQKP